MPPNALPGLNNGKAMCLPSGDQARNEGASDAGLATYRALSSPPFELVVINWYLPGSGLFLRAKAIRRPSAENVMSLSIPRTTVIGVPPRDRKSTRLNSSHVEISYAVFCLKK